MSSHPQRDWTRSPRQRRRAEVRSGSHGGHGLLCLAVLLITSCGDEIGSPIGREGPIGHFVLPWPGTECTGTDEICGNHFDEDCDGVADNGCAADCGTCTTLERGDFTVVETEAAIVRGHREYEHAWNDASQEMGVLYEDQASGGYRFFRLDTSGARVGEERAVDVFGGRVSELVYTGEGYGILYWQRPGGDEGPVVARGLLIDAEGRVSGGSTAIAGDDTEVAIAARALRIGSTVFITWISCPAENPAGGCAADNEIYLQRFDSRLQANGPRVRVTSSPLRDGSSPNGAVMAWSPGGLGILHERGLGEAETAVFSLVQDDRLAAQVEWVINDSQISALRDIDLAYGGGHFLACGTTPSVSVPGDPVWCHWVSSTGSLVGSRFVAGGDVFGLPRVALAFTGCQFVISTRRGPSSSPSYEHWLHAATPGEAVDTFEGTALGLAGRRELASRHIWMTPLPGGSVLRMHGLNHDLMDAVATTTLACP